jgi:LIVCS family branched-chain amino acid:cation transporter
MKTSVQIKLTITTGLALFAMFFGAGNMIFPLKLGSMVGEHLLAAAVTFIIAGVGVPFLGLFAVLLYEGDYWKFFNRIGKIPAFFVITFLVLIIGPLFAGPRTEIVTYHTLFPVLPPILQNPYLFDFIYCAIIFAIVYRQSSIVDIVGWILSPIKIISFAILIIFGVNLVTPAIPTSLDTHQTFKTALSMGYGTMDLIAAVFFCTIAYKNIISKCQKANLTSESSIIKIALYACLIGAILIGVTYAGLMCVAYSHAAALKDIPIEGLIEKVSALVLGEYGSLFIGICATFACIATAVAVTEVATDYFYNTLFAKKLPRAICLLLVLVISFMMAIIGFDSLMKIAGPILNVVYPAIIVLCVVNIILKLYKKTTPALLPS